LSPTQPSVVPDHLPLLLLAQHLRLLLAEHLLLLLLLLSCT
jgi:hypothetical protein